MEHFQAALDPRKQELLEARFLGARVSCPLFSVNSIILEYSTLDYYYYYIINVVIVTRISL